MFHCAVKARGNPQRLQPLLHVARFGPRRHVLWRAWLLERRKEEEEEEEAEEEEQEEEMGWGGGGVGKERRRKRRREEGSWK